MQRTTDTTQLDAHTLPSKIRLHETLHILPQISKLSESIYDTAWVARISTPDGLPRFPQLISHLIQTQQRDGSWRHSTVYAFYCDAIVSTLSAINTLIKWRDIEPKATIAIASGIDFLNKTINAGSHDAYLSVGYEIILPALVQEAQRSNIRLDDTSLQDFVIRQEKKMQAFVQHIEYNVANTTLHSLEAFSQLDIDWSQFCKVQDHNGSYLSSPAATAQMVLKTGDASGLQYLEKLVASGNGIPVNTPIDIFELNWCYEIIYNLNLQAYFATEFRDALQRLRHHWSDKGISWSSTFNLPDLDNTAVTYDLLKRSGVNISPTVFEHFKDGEVIYCFPDEADSSPTHLLHLITAIMDDPTQSDLRDRALLHVLRLFEQNGWYDKWHLSPYYVIALSIRPFTYLNVSILDDMIDFILDNQNWDGGWGPASQSNLEETAWACYGLMQKFAGEFGNDNLDIDYLLRIKTALNRGNQYLTTGIETNQAFPNLWIDKCLYTPITIVNVLIHSVMMRYALSYDK